MRLSWRFVRVVLLAVTFVLTIGIVPAFGENAAPWWDVNVGARPSVLTAGRERTVVISVTNLGDKEAIGEPSDPVLVVDTLPEGIEAEKAFYLVGPEGTSGGGSCEVDVVVPSVSVAACSYEGVVTPYLRMEADVYVSVREGLASSRLDDGVTVSGGGAPAVSVSDPLAIGTRPTEFGVETFESVPENMGGSVDTQAGSHPFQWTTTVVLNAGPESEGPEVHAFNEAFGSVELPALPRNLRVNLPPGMVGNPSPFEQCTEGEFKLKKCPLGAQVGVAVVTVAKPLSATESVPVFNMVPARGEPARFGFKDNGAAAFLDASVRTGGDYGVTVSANNITQTAAFLSSQITIWGWPGDPRHNNSRGYGCVGF